MIILQLVLYCALFTVMVKLAVGNNAVNGLYFYPKAVQDRAVRIGLTDRAAVDRKRKRFMIPFVLVMLAVLVLIIGLWNRTSDFKTAYLQALLFLEVMNWYDGIVIDRFWVGNDKFWLLPGCEDIPYVQTWRQILKKRVMLTLIWIPGAAIAAGIVVTVFGKQA